MIGLLPALITSPFLLPHLPCSGLIVLLARPQTYQDTLASGLLCQLFPLLGLSSPVLCIDASLTQMSLLKTPPWTIVSMTVAYHHLLNPRQLVTHSFLLLFCRSVVSDSLRPHGLQHTKLLCSLPSPGACSNSCPLSW